ncbi:hypothetical protein [Metallibacterium sp.]|jgi:metal-responsive CopG/Arc/MetJ family transcriptional regulator|uniref:hypothetical protein n=1 Tax=Metallibacterium sp. TaxID=2940281 RepID=UPI0026250094|nr:hypothetical protein [Metallibacterium sp.]
MKVAISVPDSLFAAADTLAAHQGKSRSQLYFEALARFVLSERASAITEQLDAVYARQSGQLEPALQHAQLHTLAHETW